MSATFVGLAGFLICVAAILIFALRRGLQLKELCHRGVMGTAVISKKWTARTGHRASHYLRYEFTAPDGRAHSRKIAVSDDEFANASVGGVIEIVYLPDQPDVSATRTLVNQSRAALKLPPI